MVNSSVKIVSYSGMVFLTLSKNYKISGNHSVDYVTIDQHGCVTLFLCSSSENRNEISQKTAKIVNAFSRLSFQDIREMCENYYHQRFEFVFEEKFDRVPSLIRPFDLNKIRVITFVNKETQLSTINLDLYITGPTDALIFEYEKNSYQLRNWGIEEVSSPVKALSNTDENILSEQNRELLTDVDLIHTTESEDNSLENLELNTNSITQNDNTNHKILINNAIQPDDEFTMGIPVMDQQHKVFFDIYKQIAELPNDEKSYDQLVYSINKLKYYIRTHFRAEEELMKKAEFAGLDDHIKEHQTFIEKIDSFSFGLEYKNPQLASQLLLFIRKWLLTHVSKTDMLYVDCVKAYLNNRSA